MADVKERHEMIKVQKEDMALKTSGQQNQIPLLGLYSRNESRTTCDGHDIAIGKPINSTTQVGGDEYTKHVNSAVTLYNMGLVHQERSNHVKASELFTMALQ
eukprot:1785446-Ditylum_brightwellii.AAC.1